MPASSGAGFIGDPRTFLLGFLLIIFHFLEATGNFLITGPTKTNVMDLRIFLVA